MGKLARKVPRKKKLKEDDKFLKVLKQSPDWVETNRTLLVTGVIALVVVLAGMFWMRDYRTRMAAEAEIRLYEAVNLVEVGSDTEGFILMEELVAKYKKTEPGKKAFYYLAGVRADEGELDEAVELYEEFLSFSIDNPVLNSSALLGVAVALENKGEFERAAGMFEKVVEDYQGTYFHYQALLGSGRCYEVLGDLERARESYSEILRTEDQELAERAENALEKITALERRKSS